MNRLWAAAALTGRAGSSSAGASRSLSTPLLSSSRCFGTSSATWGTWGGGKLKTHQGTAKRFRPISKARSRQRIVASPYLDENGASLGMIANTAESRPGPLFKRGKTGKRHLNLMVNGSRLNSLGGTAVTGKNRVGWHLRKLLAPIL